MRKDRPMDTVPSPAGHIGPEAARQIGDSIVQGGRHCLIARLGNHGPPVVAPTDVICRERVDEEPGDEAEAARVRGCCDRTEIVARDCRHEPQKPGFEDRSRVACASHVTVPSLQDVERLRVERTPWLDVPQQQRQQRDGMERDGVGLDPRKIHGRQMRSAAQQVANSRRSIWLGPVNTERVQIIARRRVVIGRDDEVLGGIVQVRKLVEGNPARPLIASARAVGRQRPVATGAHGNAAGGKVPDVPVDVAIDEVLRRRDEIMERSGEIIPIARLVDFQEGQ